ncbi:hypothetical protein [Streptomyces sp. NPDC051183]|uniref:hypothetical protein n=1 Tax=Streptomyces sp. NPDC051183 TaxID=3155165 RepID=UPI003448E80F
MDDEVVRAPTSDGVARTCEDIRNVLAAWAPQLLGVHVRDRAHAPRDVAVLVTAVADAADCTVLPGDDEAARRELRQAAVRAAAAEESPVADVRAELAAVRAGCRRAAVALGVLIPIAPASWTRLYPRTSDGRGTGSLDEAHFGHGPSDPLGSRRPGTPKSRDGSCAITRPGRDEAVRTS